MLAVLLLCVLGAKGQRDDFSGVYYITNDANGHPNDYYLLPAKNPQQEHFADAYFHNQYANNNATGDYTGSNYGDKEKPFLTTHKKDGTMDADSLVWIIEPAGEYYYIKHAATGKYLVYEYPYKRAINRKSVHLQTTANHSADIYKFDITGSLTDGINIRPINLVGDNTNRFLNPATNNTDLYYGTSTSGNNYFHVGMIGVWSGADGNSIWHLTNYTVPQPTISYNFATNEVTITSSVDGATIYYTTNGDTPTTSLTPHASPVTFTQTLSEADAIKAIAVKYGVSSEVAVFTLEKSTRPIVFVDPTTYQVSMTAVAGASIYYTTTAGEEPTTLYEGIVTLGYSFSGGTVRAIAVEEGKLPSDVTQVLAVFQCKTPQIDVNYTTERISISCEDQDAMLYYTLDGSEPNEGSTAYTGPFTVPGSGVYTVKVKAFRTNFHPSVTVSAQVEKVATPTIQADASLTYITITASDGATIYYTNNGSTPTTASFPYTEPLDFTFSLQPIKAIACKANAFSSDVAYNSIQLKCPTPEIYPDFETNMVYLYCDATDATMYYTVDGSDPTTSSTATQYTGTPFPLPESGTIKAYATRPNCYPSDVAIYGLDKAATPTIQASDDDKYITISTATIGADLYYTIDGSEPDPDNNPNTIRYVGPFREGPNHERVSDVAIKAIAVKSGLFWSDVATETVMLKCDAPRIIHSNEYEFTFSCPFPTSGAQVYYTEDGTEATSSSSLYTTPVTVSQLPLAEAFHARAYATHYLESDETIKTFSTSQLDGDGNDANPYLIESDYEYRVFVAMANGEYPGAHYKLIADIDASDSEMVGQNFTGMFESAANEEGIFYSISNLDHPMFSEIDPGVVNGSFPTNRGIVRNVVLKDVNISNHSGNTGAIACRITGGACIYNCGILSGEVGGTGNVGGIVGLLDYTPYNYPNEKNYSLTRVINCYSFADITSKGADGAGDNSLWAAGIVGNNNYESKIQNYPFNNNDCKFKTAVVNCMFYGDITTQHGSNIAPVYGNKLMGTSGGGEQIPQTVNRYDYFKDGAEFVNTFDAISDYKFSWPAEEKYLTKYEYYRSILNSNRLLCTSYVTGKKASEVYQDTACIAKWVRDESIAPYPILKKWGKYPSVINPDPVRVWDTATDRWIYRVNARDYEGRSFSTLNVTVKPGEHALGSLVSQNLSLVITDMDTLRDDYGYYKVQLPYYNELYGNVNSTDHVTRYGGNYTDWVVTGWKITKVNGQASGATTFEENWEHGYNFADRKDKFRDLYSISHRVYAQGGFYYVPEGVTSIEIEAYWGKACYMRNKGQSIDRVGVTNPRLINSVPTDYDFKPSGNLPSTFQGHTVYDNLQDAIASLGSIDDYPTVYDQAIVLVGNLQVLNKNKRVGSNIDGVLHPFTIMSADFDLDNEPDYCFQFQFRDGLQRWPIQPIRFDFLAVPELGLAVRHDDNAYAIGIFVPQGHFEITETAYMHTTQFEYEGIRVVTSYSATAPLPEEIPGFDYQYTPSGNKINVTVTYVKNLAPVILNGGQFEQIVIRHSGDPNTTVANHTSYILMGGHFRMKRFTPGAHTSRGEITKVRLCAVNCIGGEYPEFYLSGIYRPDINPNVSYFGVAGQGNPHCYTNGGKFGSICGAGYDKILGDVTFKIDHSIIGEFYGGGINGACPVGGNIDVTIDHSLVGKYCGGPKVGEMGVGKTVTTHATGTTFGQFYGGGNGGNTYYREQVVDGNSWTLPANDWDAWESVHPSSSATIVYDPENPNLGFNPLNRREDKDKIYHATKGYHDIFEFEVFNASNGLGGEDPTIRTYVHWAQFGTTRTGDVTSTLTDCVVLQDFYGGGNLGFVAGNATSTLQGNTIIYGSAFGGGYSAAIPSFRCYDLSRAVFPTRDYSGVMHNGQLETEEIPYVQDGEGNDIYYEWINEIPDDWSMPPGFTLSTDNPIFEYPANSGHWYCYTTKSLENLGVVQGNTVLNVNGNTKIYGRKKSEVGDEPDPEALEFAGAAFGGGNESDVMGNSKVTVSGTAGLLVSNVYGGGNIAVTHGNSEVEIIKGTIGVHRNGVPRPGSGRVFGGGKGAYDEDADENGKHLGDVLGNSTVVMRGGKVLTCLYGGCELSNVGRTNEIMDEGYPIEVPVANTGLATVVMKGGEVGFERTFAQMTAPDADQTICCVYGGGMGDPDVAFNTWTNVNSVDVSIEGGKVWGSVFGGGEDGHVLGDIHLSVSQNGNNITHIGTVGTSGVDGNVFGGGRGYQAVAKTAGSTGGNVTVNISGGTMLGNVYGGGEMASVGTYFSPEDDPVHYGVMQTDTQDESHGHITMSITGGTIGFDLDPEHPYSPQSPYIHRVGNVFGACQGYRDRDRLDFAKVKTTDLYIGGNAYIWGNLYGGGEMGKVKDSVNVVIGDNATVRLRAFAGGQGYDDEENPDDEDFKHAADVGEIDGENTVKHGLARITLKDHAKVQVCLYGGAQIASIHGNAYVTLLGGEVGRKRTLEEYSDPTHPLYDPHQCYVFGSGQGNPTNGKFNEWTNVDTAFVTIRPGSRVFGSVFGGGEDGHVLEDIFLDIELGANDTIGTFGYSKVDGNIFSGGRGFNPQALTAGGTRGNIHTHIHGAGHILGSVFGGGRIASTGIHLLRAPLDGLHPGDTIADTPTRTYGHIDILIEDDVIIGHDHVDGYKIGDIGGNVYGGAMGEDVAPTTVAGKMSHVKQTEVVIKDNVWVKGTVNGGGESGHVWKDTRVTIEGNATIGVDRVGENHVPVDSLIYSGNVFGGSWGSDSLLWVNEGRVYGNTTVLIKGGHIRNNIYGGGEYASVGTIDTIGGVPVPRAGTGHCTVIMDGGELGPLDMTGLNAYVFGGGKGVGEDPLNEKKDFGNVFTTHVVIEDDAKIWGSVFGGGEDGHVRDTVQIDVNGGNLGTTGTTTWDGNIFGGGRNYFHTNLSAGRVGGNITVNITDVTMLGSVYGGGRLGSVGVDENGVMQSGDDHGYTKVNISGGVIGNNADGHVGGNVYGGCKGYVENPSISPLAPQLAYAKQTEVNITQAAGKQTYIKGSVFGGGEDGHIRDNTYVNIYAGQIGGIEYNPQNPSMSQNRFHGNVYGGGRGLDQYENPVGSGHWYYSSTAGKVYGNTYVNITGGRICRSVYGGGSVASVGVENDNATGECHVTITGDAQVGTTNDAHVDALFGGNVYGAGKGRAGSLYRDLTFSKRTYVNIEENARIHGSVFGGGEDGHVRQTSEVNIKGGVIGDSETTCQNKYHGNVYGAGRGIDETDDQSATGYSWTAGRVNWNATVNISGGHIYRNVYGGGNLASVGRVKRDANYEPDPLPDGSLNPLDQNDEPMYNDDGTLNPNFDPALLTGWTHVNIMGGVIGTDIDEDDLHGNVFGSSHGRAGVLYKDLAYVHNTEVRIEEDPETHTTPLIKGSVFGGGEDGHVTINTKVTVNAGQIGAKVGDPWKGNVYGGGRGIDLDEENNLSPTAGLVKGHTRVYINGGIISDCVFGGGNMSAVWGEKVVNINAGTVKGDVFGGSKAVPEGRRHIGLKTVNVRGGEVWGNVYGCSYNCIEGEEEHPTASEPAWTAFVNINAGIIGALDTPDGNVHGAGKAGIVKGSTCVNIGKNTIVQQVGGVNQPRISANEYYNDCGGDEPGLTSGQTEIEPVVGTLVIRGSVYGGSDYYGGNTSENDFEHFDATGYTNVLIDGSDYDTRSQSEEAENYMNIGGGIFGSSTHCESGELGRNILLKDYGERTELGDVEMQSATRTLTTIQRASYLIMLHSNVNLSGTADISGQANRNFGVYKAFGIENVDGVDRVVGGMYVSDASSIVLGASDAPAYMDMIKQLNSVKLASGSVYDAISGGHLTWKWLGIQGNTPETASLYYIDETTPSGAALTKDQENVILFNGDSRLWVRYLDGTSVPQTQKYGQLYGFFRMRSPFQPYGTESFAYARPKITEGSTDNTADGGFLSYQTDYNFFTDAGVNYTNTKQHPYTNVLQFTKGDRIEYREWVIREFQGRRWYVDGTRGWGRDDKSKTEGWGLFPDKPKKTVSGSTGYKGICTEYFTEVSQLNLNYDFEKDIIYVVGALSAADESNLLQGGTVGEGLEAKSYPLKLYRYPGGHPLSWSEGNANEAYFDEGDGTLNPSSTNEGLTHPDKTGPGANYGAMLEVQADESITLDNVQMDGLYGHLSGDDTYLLIPGNNYPDPDVTPYPVESETDPHPGEPIDPSLIHVPSFVEGNVTKPLITTQSNSTLSLVGSTMNGTGVAKQGVVLERGYNNTEANVWFSNPDYVAQANVYHGGAIYVDNGATVNVSGMVTVTGNQQNNAGTPIESNLYLPTFSKHININGTLSSGTSIGITSPIRNAQPNYRQNTLSPIAEATNNDMAQSAWVNCNLYDDLNWFFVNGHRAVTPRKSYYGGENTLYFGWTWANVVRTQPAGYDDSNSGVVSISSERGLAWLSNVVNGMYVPSASDLSGTMVQLATGASGSVKDVYDMQQYVWVPIGAKTSSTAEFAGTFDGQGHLITNIDIDYIGEGDLRYERVNYGLFGAIDGATINRTFVVSGYYAPVGTAYLGGLVGMMEGDNAVVSNSEAAVEIHCPDKDGSVEAAGGLVGLMKNGEVHSSMAMPLFYADEYSAIGGLIGKTDDVALKTIKNSFANARFVIEPSSIAVVGGIVGVNKNANIENCYNHLQEGCTGLNAANFALLVGRNDGGQMRNSYGQESDYLFTQVTQTGDNGVRDCYKYSPVMDADNLGYMFYDNVLNIDDVSLAMYKHLNRWVRQNNTVANGYKYSYWTRPALPEINGDYPVLTLYNGTTGTEGNGDFRSLATYHNGAALQYGGEVRDGDDDQLGSMLARSESIFVYGDVEEDLRTATVNATKISLYEHAAMLHPGRLSTFPNTYVGISFDNSHQNGPGTSTIGVNYGLNGLGMGPYPLPRDWHMFSSPLRNAPLGFDYKDHNEENLYVGGDYNAANFYNNPWLSISNEFSWLQSEGSDNVRYWMKGWENSQSQSDPEVVVNSATWADGYFPSRVAGAFEFGQGLIEGTDEEDRYPYGMDFYTWTEPDYHWINFKRNGPNHWHSDEINGHHDHIDYVPVDGATPNVNEEELIVGRGYMAAICDTTFMQSHGRLNAGNDLGIAVTNTGASKAPGMNLVGNPYHAYLDFDLFASSNSGLIDASYVIYDADQYTDYAESAFHFYPSGGSEGGDYADQYLHPHQGFFVLAKNAGDLSFTEDMVVTRQNSKFRSWQPNYPLVNLYLSSNNGCADVTVIEFDRPEWGGAVKLKQLRQGNGVFYAQHNNTHYSALFAKIDTERVPLWFEAKEDDTFTIKWNTANGDFHSMYLIDNITGVRYDMLANDSYTFQGHVGDYPSRFYITFSVTDVEEYEEDNTFVFFDGSQWLVTGEGQLEFIDLQGQVLWSKQVFGGQSRVGLPDVACGMYLFRLTNGVETKIQKVIVSR